MEKTVTVSLEHYDELRNTIKKLKENSVNIYTARGYQKWITKDEAIIELSKINEELTNTYHKNVKEFAKYSLYKFYKWRKYYNEGI